ncbi:MAG: CoA-acylating methylmalonate-semialdehyde dehydrogenase, partial [Actinomycetota bacterium]
MNDLTHWIDGARHDGVGTRTSPVFDPATGEQTGAVRLAGPTDVDRAVASAAAAGESWREVPLGRRVDVLFRYRDLVDRHRADLARLVSAEHGKVFADALGEVQRGLEVVELACGIPSLLKGEITPDVATSVDAYSIRQPLGVVAGITPFNFPVMVPMWMYPVAIACGNTFVLKPSEKDPSPSLLAAELFAEAGLPDGVLNVVQGDAEAVNVLLEHPTVRAVSFVGSTPIARHVYETATRHGKRVQALGGAKNHMIVLPDADLGAAADAAVSAGYGSAGERCMAISVVVAVGDVGDRLVPAIAERTRALDVGPGLRDPDDPANSPDMGALVTGAHRDRVAGYLELGL